MSGIFKKVLEASGKDIFSLHPALSNVIETVYNTILAIELAARTLNICIENAGVPLYRSRLNLTVVTSYCIVCIITISRANCQIAFLLGKNNGTRQE